MEIVPGNKIIFLHVPKSGGTTLCSVIARNYENGRVFTLGGTRDDMLAFMKYPPREINAYDCVQGHMGFGMHKYFMDKVRYISLLRQPVRRLISFYQHVRRTQGHYLHGFIQNDRMSLDEFIISDLTHELHNGQTRLIASENGLGINFFDKKILDNGDLERAKLHLREHFIAVGIMERFDDFLGLLKHLLDWKNISYEKQNVGPSEADQGAISAKTLEILKNNNKIDFELYNYALELFEEKLMKCAESVKCRHETQKRNYEQA